MSVSRQGIKYTDEKKREFGRLFIEAIRSGLTRLEAQQKVGPARDSLMKWAQTYFSKDCKEIGLTIKDEWKPEKTSSKMITIPVPPPKTMSPNKVTAVVFSGDPEGVAKMLRQALGGND